ncbi:MAG: hypothetical protein LBF22_08345, partial [Deltaproteobacteria bacterium]|nr:hypothetical protein [Deltaproteobacteria bacterium]
QLESVLKRTCGFLRRKRCGSKKGVGKKSVPISLREVPGCFELELGFIVTFSHLVALRARSGGWLYNQSLDQKLLAEP